MARVSPAATTTNTITLLGGELMPFQVEAVAYIKAHRGRTLIADEVGLGKTVEALAWLAERPDLRLLILAPDSRARRNRHVEPALGRVRNCPIPTSVGGCVRAAGRGRVPVV